MLASSNKPCRQHAKQKSCLTESANMAFVSARVGKALVSTRLRASVIQYSEVRGGKNDAESVERRRGILLIRKERRAVMESFFSFRKVALANTSKEARIRSIAVLCRSPYPSQYSSTA
jgi:hypothetical protein